MIDELKKKSFAGIYVDKRAYDEEGFVSLYASLKAERDSLLALCHQSVEKQ